MNRTATLRLDIHAVPGLEETIDNGFVAQDRFKMQSTEENRREYNATRKDRQGEQ